MPSVPKKSRSKPWSLDSKNIDNNSRSIKSNYSEYNSQQWRKYSKEMRALMPLCYNSLKKGIILIADVTDHIIPVNQGGSFWDVRNHRTLSHKEHNKKSGLEAHGIIEAWVYNDDGDKIPEENRGETLKSMLSKYEVLKKNILFGG